MRPPAFVFAALSFFGVAAGAPAAQPIDPVEAAAFGKVLGIGSGSLEAVSLSEIEVNALLGSVQLAAFLNEQAGLVGVRVGLHPDEVRLRGRVDAERLRAALGPLAPPPGTPPQPVELVVRLRGAGGSGEVAILRGAVAGVALPPRVIGEAVLGGLVGVSESTLEKLRGPVLEGTPFALPAGLDTLEVRAGELFLLPAAP